MLPHETLSSRESQVFQLLVTGKGIIEIAETLKLHVTTVSTYRARILEKIDTKKTLISFGKQCITTWFSDTAGVQL